MSKDFIFISESTQDRRVSDIAIAGLVVLFVVAIYGWFVLPDTIPIHFGFDGRPHKFNYLVPIDENNARRQYVIALSMLNWFF